MPIILLFECCFRDFVCTAQCVRIQERKGADIGRRAGECQEGSETSTVSASGITCPNEFDSRSAAVGSRAGLRACNTSQRKRPALTVIDAVVVDHAEQCVGLKARKGNSSKGQFSCEYARKALRSSFADLSITLDISIKESQFSFLEVLLLKHDPTLPRRAVKE